MGTLESSYQVWSLTQTCSFCFLCKITDWSGGPINQPRQGVLNSIWINLEEFLSWSFRHTRKLSSLAQMSGSSQVSAKITDLNLHYKPWLKSLKSWNELETRSNLYHSFTPSARPSNRGAVLSPLFCSQRSMQTNLDFLCSSRKHLRKPCTYPSDSVQCRRYWRRLFPMAGENHRCPRDFLPGLVTNLSFSVCFLCEIIDLSWRQIHGPN